MENTEKYCNIGSTEMKKFVIAIEETIVQDFYVIAENCEQAINIAEEKYKKGEFVLEPGILCSKQMAVLSPADEVTEWTEF